MRQRSLSGSSGPCMTEPALAHLLREQTTVQDQRYRHRHRDQRSAMFTGVSRLITPRVRVRLAGSHPFCTQLDGNASDGRNAFVTRSPRRESRAAEKRASAYSFLAVSGNGEGILADAHRPTRNHDHEGAPPAPDGIRWNGCHASGDCGSASGHASKGTCFEAVSFSGG